MQESPNPTMTSRAADAPFLAGDGEMARLMREFDWSTSPVGPVEQWPESLRVAVSICLASRFPIEIWWGPEYARFYNDAYRPILGTKHPQFLGRPGRECWGEIWDVIGPMLDSVRATGKATWSEDHPLMVLRNGYVEETYFTFSYAPLFLEDGSVGGIFCACAETTARVLSDRRLRTLRALVAPAAVSASMSGEAPVVATTASTVEDTCGRLAKTLVQSSTDVPFALLYLVEPGFEVARLVAATGLRSGEPASPERISLVEKSDAWPLTEVARTRRSLRVDLLAERLEALPGHPWPEPSREVVVLPLFRGGHDGAQGFLVAGVSPRVALDVAYGDFFELAAGHVATAIADAQAYQEERHRAEEMTERARRAQLGADVGAALTGGEPLAEQLRRCAEAIVKHLDAAFARIWVLRPGESVLELRASAGLYTHLDGAHSRVPVGALKIGLIAKEREPHLTNDVLHDPRVGDKEWAAREGMVAFAGYPLIVDGELVGVMAMFARKALGDEMIRALASIADSISVGIEHRRAEDEVRKLLVREQAALAEVERQRLRLTSLFLQAPAGICVLRGREHVYELVNPRYAQLIGDRDVVGMPIREALPETADAVIPLLDRVYETGEPYFGDEFPVLLARRGALEEGFFNFIYQPIHDAAGKVEGIVVLAFEVTDQVRARLRAEQLKEALEVTNQDLDQFAYVASHDLKAPLRGIANLSQWIEEGLADKMDAETRRQMDLLRGRVHRLEALINGILSYSRAGRVREKMEPVDVGALLVESVELLAPPKEVSIVVGEGMPTLQAERVPLQQVFMNLIGNALKHARCEGARIEIACADAGAFHDFTVKDNGPGIAKQFHDRIWGIFQMLEARDKVEGTGIGLSVVKKIVESRGGRVAVESEPGRGATFHVYWPKRPKEPS